MDALLNGSGERKFTLSIRRFVDIRAVARVSIIIVLASFAFGPDAYCQNKWYSTPNRGGVEGAKGQVILQTLMNENALRRSETAANSASITALKDATDASLTTIGDCGAQGMIYGPGHAAVDGNDCISSFQIADDGNIQFQAGAKFGSYELCDPTTEGTIRYNASAKRMEFCNGEVWGMLGGNNGCSINFPAITDAQPDTFYDTTDAVYSGTTATASVAGATAATIRRNGGNTGNSSGVTINQGNSVGIHGKSAALFNQTAGFTLDIGAYTACWQITTKQQDVTPNSFSFTNLNGQELNTLVTSNSATVNGFDGPLTVSVSGQGNPQLSVNGGSWASSSAISAGQSLRVRLTSSDTYSATISAFLNLGTYSTSWAVTTKQNGCNTPCGFVPNGGGWQGNASACGDGWSCPNITYYRCDNGTAVVTGSC